MLHISPIPAFDDNYIWLLRASESKKVVVVDPGDEDPVLETLEGQDLELFAILITHKHGDHTDGVAELKQKYPNAKVYGPANEQIMVLTDPVAEGDVIVLEPLEAEFTVMEVPGHTEGHLAYYGDGVLFCGDTLFAGGCGRVFTGTHEQLHHSLERIAKLPAETQVYCAHEYTQSNMGFAKWVEPENPDVLQRIQEVDALRENGVPTVPSLLEVELKTNPFMRTANAKVVAAAERYAGEELAEGAAIFTAIRTWKDKEYD